MDNVDPHQIAQRAGDVAELQERLLTGILGARAHSLRVIAAAHSATAAASALGDDSSVRLRRECRSGCSACCHLAVSLTAAEALWIAARLRALHTPGGLAGVRARVAETSARVSALTIEQRAEARIACALLGPAGDCTIHDFRPIGCRAWNSLARAACDAALATGQSSPDIPFDTYALAVGSAVTEGLERALRAVRLDAGQYEFHSALLRALDVEQAAERFAGGEPVFTGCARVRSQRLLPVAASDRGA